MTLSYLYNKDALFHEAAYGVQVRIDWEIDCDLYSLIDHGTGSLPGVSVGISGYASEEAIHH